MRVLRQLLIPLSLLLFGCWATLSLHAQEYFVTYSHQMEEPGNLEVATRAVTGFPKGGNSFVGNAFELEYGVKTWWTSEVYLDGQSTTNESTVFTGYRWENRFRPLLREHWINPVLYVEFANVNSADKTLLEVVGHDGRAANHDALGGVNSLDAAAHFHAREDWQVQVHQGQLERARVAEAGHASGGRNNQVREECHRIGGITSGIGGGGHRAFIPSLRSAALPAFAAAAARRGEV